MEVAIARSEAGREVSPAIMGLTGDHEGAANYVVPHYSESGHKTRHGVFLSTEATKKMERIMQRYGERVAGGSNPELTPAATEMPVVASGPKKRGRKKAVVAPVPPTVSITPPAYDPHIQPAPAWAPVDKGAAPQQSRSTSVVVFHIPTGEIKVVVDAVLNTDTGLALVFADETEIRFVPKQGNELTLTLPGGHQVPVMYLGVVYQWYNSCQQVMTFIKLDN